MTKYEIIENDEGDSGLMACSLQNYTKQQQQPPCTNCKHAEKAADLAVKKVFAILGVDIEKPESVEGFREDLRFGHKLRKVADQGLFFVLSIVFAGLIVAFADKFWK